MGRVLQKLILERGVQFVKMVRKHNKVEKCARAHNRLHVFSEMVVGCYVPVLGIWILRGIFCLPTLLGLYLNLQSLRPERLREFVSLRNWLTVV